MKRIAPMNRRSFIYKAGTAGIGLGLGGLLPAFATNPDGIASTRISRPGRRLVNLDIGKTPFTIDGKSANPTTINGSLPGPLLRFTEGDEAIIRVSNKLEEDTSIHWHGILLPPDMDGVPGVSFNGIPPATTFEYRYELAQTGTYWYHSHSGLQEQEGVYGPLIVDPAGKDPIAYDREHVIVLSDWTFDDPRKVLSNLKKVPGYYNYQKRTLAGLLKGERGGVQNRLAWSRMRMDATDLADVTGNVYTFLMNGHAPGTNWTGLFQKGEKVRLRIINAGAGTFFDVRIPGLKMTVVQADGMNVKPVEVDELRIALAETYDVIVEPADHDAYTIFAESMDRSGYARGTLAASTGLSAPIPERRKVAIRSMRDMGMTMDMHGGMQMEDDGPNAMDHGQMNHAGMNQGEMISDDQAGMNMQMKSETDLRHAGTIPDDTPHGKDGHGPGNAGVPMQTSSRLDEPGIGLEDQPHRVLLYTDLEALNRYEDRREPTREIELHLTGNMERYMWSFDGKKFSSGDEPIRLQYGERVRLTFVNDTMMEHPIHLHGMWMELENGRGADIPRKHTINVKPAERVSLLVTADASGRWAMHCHILYHMEMGMFRVFEVSEPETAEVSDAK